jgi:hypothetical protein
MLACVNSAFLDRRHEAVRVQAVVITEMELADIERQIFFGNYSLWRRGRLNFRC